MEPADGPPSSASTTAATCTRSFFLNFAGSMKPRYGGDVSTDSLRHFDEPARLTANATLTGAVPPTVAVAVQRFVNGSAFTVSFGCVGAGDEAVAPAFSSSAPIAGTETVSLPLPSLSAEPEPS